MKIKKLLEEQVRALRLENSTLRQAVPPEKQKYLPNKPQRTPEPPSFKEKFKALLPKIGKILAVVAVLGAIAALVAVEIAILTSKDKNDTAVEERLPESVPYAANASGLNAYFGGSITEFGDRLYFVSSHNGQLYYRDINQNIKRVDGASVENLMAVSDSVYYINRSTAVLHKTGVTENNIKAVGRALCTYAIITEDGIYCIAAEKGEIRKYPHSGLEYETVTTDLSVTTFDLWNEDLFILSDGDLLLLKEGSDTPQLLKSEIHLSGIVGDRLMISDGQELFVFDGEKFNATGVATKDFNGNGDILICQNPEIPTMLYLHGNGIVKILAADYKSGLTVTENYVSYLSVDGFTYLIEIATGQRSVLSHR